MTDITKTDEYDEVELVESADTLVAIAKFYERIEPRARTLYTALEDIRYNEEHPSWRSRHTYDGFRLDGYYIELIGSYYSRCDGNQEQTFSVSFADFFDPEYLDKKQAEAQERRDIEIMAEARKAADLAHRKETEEREQYARLKAKFGE